MLTTDIEKEGPKWCALSVVISKLCYCFQYLCLAESSVILLVVDIDQINFVIARDGDNNMATPPVAERPEVKVFGVDLSHHSQQIQFAVLGGGALVSALVFAFLQEKVRL